MTTTKSDVDYDLTLNLNLTLSVNIEDILSLKNMIKDGDIEADSVENYITQLIIDDIENQDEMSVWIPETDGTIRAWITGSWSEKSAEELSDG